MAGTSRHPTPPTPRRPTPRWPPARARELPLPEQERKPKALPFLRRAVRAALRHPPGARSASPRHLHPRLPLTSALNVGPRRRPCRPQLTPLRRQNGGYLDLRSCFESFENRVAVVFSYCTIACVIASCARHSPPPSGCAVSPRCSPMRRPPGPSKVPTTPAREGRSRCDAMPRARSFAARRQVHENALREDRPAGDPRPYALNRGGAEPCPCV